MILYTEFLNWTCELCSSTLSFLFSLLTFSFSSFLAVDLFLLPFSCSLYKSEEISHSFFFSLCLICHFLRFASPPFFFVLLNLPAVCVALGLVFCGSISGVCVSFMLWMVLETGFTAPAVMPQHFSFSRLAVKWSEGPLARRLPGHYC